MSRRTPTHSCSNCVHWLGVGTPRTRSACGLRGNLAISDTSYDFHCADHVWYGPLTTFTIDPAVCDDVTIKRLEGQLSYAIQMRERQDKHWSSVVELRRREYALAVAHAKKKEPLADD